MPYLIQTKGKGKFDSEKWVSDYTRVYATPAEAHAACTSDDQVVIYATEKEVRDNTPEKE